MNVFVLLLMLAIVLGAIAAPVVFALRRRARLAAALAAAAGFGAQALFVSYLQGAPLGPEQGALMLLVGVPGIALATCAIAMLAIARTTSRVKS
jgi:peptidoglycan/LPS O-acetylase OafA/YrhL